MVMPIIPGDGATTITGIVATIRIGVTMAGDPIGTMAITTAGRTTTGHIMTFISEVRETTGTDGPDGVTITRIQSIMDRDIMVRILPLPEDLSKRVV